MSDEAVKELKFHQDVIQSGENSPLELIREKEIEISGRVLSAKRQADEIVADARRRAAEIIGAAESEGDAGGEELRQAVKAEAEAESTRVAEEADVEVEQMKERVLKQRDEATKLILASISKV